MGQDSRRHQGRRHRGGSSIRRGPAGKRSPHITGSGNMKFKEDRPFANPEVAEQGLLELANAMEADHAGRLLDAVINKQFLPAGGRAAEYSAAAAPPVEHAWLPMHPSRAYPSFTHEGAH